MQQTRRPLFREPPLNRRRRLVQDPRLRGIVCRQLIQAVTGLRLCENFGPRHHLQPVATSRQP
ncbi:hypothetical protein OAG90_02385, partial [bacterium]|nr:hypothetical protein [bacterium]